MASRVGEGSCFTVFLPVRKRQAMKPRIMIVDDERGMCELLETDLRLRDFAPRCFASGGRGLRSLLPRGFRRRAHRPADARHGRAGVLPPAGGQPARHAGDRDDRLRQPGIGDRGHSRRGLRLRHQADRNGAAGADPPPRGRAAAAPAADPFAPRDAAASRAVRRTARPKPGHAQALRPVGPDRRLRRLGADHGRERHGQGSWWPRRCTAAAAAARSRSWP